MHDSHLNQDFEPSDDDPFIEEINQTNRLQQMDIDDTNLSQQSQEEEEDNVVRSDSIDDSDIVRLSESSSSSTSTVVAQDAQITKTDDLLNEKQGADAPYEYFNRILDYVIDFLQNNPNPLQNDQFNSKFNEMKRLYTQYCSSNIINDNYAAETKLTLKLIQFCVLWLKIGHYNVLNILSFVFNSKAIKLSFNSNNETVIANEDFASEKENIEYLKTSKFKKSFQVQFINYFGQLNGFDYLLKCFEDLIKKQEQSENDENTKVTINIIYLFLNPFENCLEFLKQDVLKKYLLTIINYVPNYFENSSNGDLKKKITDESEIIFHILKICKKISMKLGDEQLFKKFEFLRLKLVLRLLRFSSFMFKMNALNEINKCIAVYSCNNNKEDSQKCFRSPITPQSMSSSSSTTTIYTPGIDACITADELAQWLIENNVLEIILKDCLHQPHYVEKLDCIIRFLLKQNALSLECLDLIWNSQVGKHEVIQKNIHALIAKLAWNFSPDQLNHLFLCFTSNFSNSSLKELEKLLELMRILAEDDKDGSMANKVLSLLWNIAYNVDVDKDIDQALIAHVKILDYNKTYDKDSQKILWINECINEIRKSPSGNNVLTALKHIREIVLLFPISQDRNRIASRNDSLYLNNKNLNSNKMASRIEIVDKIFEANGILILILESLESYMNWIRIVVEESQKSSELVMQPDVPFKGRRYTHSQELQQRLDFLKFCLQECEKFLNLNYADQIWNCLAKNSIFKIDRQICFHWFSSLVENELDYSLETTLKFLETNIIKLEPTLMDINGVECFEKFFKAANIDLRKLIYKNRKLLLIDNDLVGLDYLWKLILICEDKRASEKAISFLIEIFTNLGPDLMISRTELHYDLINTCFDRLKASFDTITVIERDPDQTRIQIELTKMQRVLSILYEYIIKCDDDFNLNNLNSDPISSRIAFDRKYLPMAYSSRGNQVLLTIKILNMNRVTEKIELISHTKESLFSIKSKIIKMLQISEYLDLEFIVDNAVIDPLKIKYLSCLTDENKTFVLSVRLVNVNTVVTNSSNIVQNSNGIRRNITEETLPGVIVTGYVDFLFQIADLAMSLKNLQLRAECIQVLGFIPSNHQYVELIRNFFENTQISKDNCNSDHDTSELNDELVLEKFNQEFESSPNKTIYLLNIIYSLLLPANITSNQQSDFKFQSNFVLNKFAIQILNFLIRDDKDNNKFFKNSDITFKIYSTLRILKISKFTLTTLSFLKMYESVSQNSRYCETLKHVPSDITLKNTVANITQTIKEKAEFQNRLKDFNFVPTRELIEKILLITWTTATGKIDSIVTMNDPKELHDFFIINFCNQNMQNDSTDSQNHLTPHQQIILKDVYELCNEALELLTILFLLSPNEVQNFFGNEKYHYFIIDLLLLCPKESIRTNAMLQLTYIMTKCVSNREISDKMLGFMFQFLKEFVPGFYQTSGQFFQFFCNLIKFNYDSDFFFTTFQEILSYELNLLSNPKENFYINDCYDDTLLQGHLNITKELVPFLNSNDKFEIGLKNSLNHNGLVKLLIDQYLFTASNSLCFFSQTDQISENIYPVCLSPKSLIAASNLLVSLCNGCIGNLHFLCNNLENYFNTFMINTWEYFPNISTRPNGGFVGLKNAGATCYMNSVIQQLFMIPEVRDGILSVNFECEYHFEDLSKESFYQNNLVTRANRSPSSPEDTKAYNVEILKQIQIIFGNLLLSQYQFYEPRGFWRNFKMYDGPINVREQHDALEFFNTLFDNLDEALKFLKEPMIMSKVFGGTFSDQKICKDCPHRYYREESFTSLNVDIRNYHTLSESLEQYVRGDLLEGDNAYYCEKCARKVNTVKRLCIKKLPKILVIQLKRFDFDYEREVPIKFNDYFEFPRQLNMEPYTVDGLARKEGEIIEDLSSGENSNMNSDVKTQYELHGIVVHSGQANGGHYHSFILHKTQNGLKKWYRFDDADVTECKLDQDEEMKNQCFGNDNENDFNGPGGDDLINKKYQTFGKNQKRCYNAFILFYRKIEENSGKTVNREKLSSPVVSLVNVNEIMMPGPIRRNVQHQNMILMHQRTLFSDEFHIFMKTLLQCNLDQLSSNDNENVENIIKITLNIAAKFMYNFSFRCKKSLRNHGVDFYEILNPYLRYSINIAEGFIQNYLLNFESLFPIYLLECPSQDVRQTFCKIIGLLLHFTSNETDASAPDSYPYRIILTLIKMLHKEVIEHAKQSTQYFVLFEIYTKFGPQQRKQLLMLNVASLFIKFAISEQILSNVQFVDAELYKTVSILVRSCDLSYHLSCGSILNSQDSISNEIEPTTESDGSKLTSHVDLKPNPYRFFNNDNISGIDGDYLMPIPEDLYKLLFLNKQYIRKIIKEELLLDENIILFKFCCWENIDFSTNLINELLLQINNIYEYESEPYLNVLYAILNIEDNCMKERIQYAICDTQQNTMTQNQFPSLNQQKMNVNFNNSKNFNMNSKGLLDIIIKNDNSTRLLKRNLSKKLQCLDLIIKLLKSPSLVDQNINLINDNEILRIKWTKLLRWLRQMLKEKFEQQEPQQSFGPLILESNRYPVLSNILEICKGIYDDGLSDDHDCEQDSANEKDNFRSDSNQMTVDQNDRLDQKENQQPRGMIALEPPTSESSSPAGVDLEYISLEFKRMLSRSKVHR